jgi:hypothetical protein
VDFVYVIIGSGTWTTLWPLFGGANQLLAALALLTGTIWIVNETDYNPCESGHIEVDKSELQTTSRHVVVLRDMKERLNDWAEKFVYDR